MEFVQLVLLFTKYLESISVKYKLKEWTFVEVDSSMWRVIELVFSKPNDHLQKIDFKFPRTMLSEKALDTVPKCFQKKTYTITPASCKHKACEGLNNAMLYDLTKIKDMLMNVFGTLSKQELQETLDDEELVDMFYPTEPIKKINYFLKPEYELYTGLHIDKNFVLHVPYNLSLYSNSRMTVKSSYQFDVCFKIRYDTFEIVFCASNPYIHSIDSCAIVKKGTYQLDKPTCDNSNFANSILPSLCYFTIPDFKNSSFMTRNTVFMDLQNVLKMFGAATLDMQEYTGSDNQENSCFRPIKGPGSEITKAADFNALTTFTHKSFYYLVPQGNHEVLKQFIKSMIYMFNRQLFESSVSFYYPKIEFKYYEQYSLSFTGPLIPPISFVDKTPMIKLLDNMVYLKKNNAINTIPVIIKPNGFTNMGLRAIYEAFNSNHSLFIKFPICKFFLFNMTGDFDKNAINVGLLSNPGIIGKFYPSSLIRAWGPEWISYLKSGPCGYMELDIGDEDEISAMMEIRERALQARVESKFIWTKNVLHTAEFDFELDQFRLAYPLIEAAKINIE